MDVAPFKEGKTDEVEISLILSIFALDNEKSKDI